MKSSSAQRLFYVLVFAVPILAFAVVNWYEKRIQELPVLGPRVKESGKYIYQPIGDFSMVNQDGKTISTNDWKDKIVIADFFFTHCPSVCPAMTKNLLRVQQEYKEDKEVLICSFSVDPERDSVNQLKMFSNKFGIDNRNWHLLTGEKKAIYKLARNSFQVVATDGDGGPSDFIHSEKLVLIDKQKRIRGYYQGTDKKETDQLIVDIKKLKNEN